MDKKRIIVFLILILAIAGFFRLWHLNSIPPGLYPDEAMNGNDAIEALKTGEYKLFYPNNNGREGLFINLQALSLKIFGIHIWALRIVSALVGILTVLGLYLLTKELFRVVLRSYPRSSAIKPLSKSPEYQATIIALLSAFFLAISFWHINFSRIGFRAIMVPLLLVWSFYFIFKAINDTENSSPLKRRTVLRKVVYCLLSGFFFGLGFYTYIAFRLAIIILIVPLVMIWIKFFKEYKTSGRLWTTYFKKRFWKYDLWLITIIIVALPLVLYFFQNPQDFIGRAGGVSILARENPIKALILSTVKTLGMFNIAGDWNWRHNFAGSPQLLWPIGILFLLGLVLSIKKLIKSAKEKHCSLFIAHCLLLTWFIVMLLPAILTYEGIPHALRSIGVIPVCYIFAALGACAVYKFLYKFVESKRLNKSLLFAACYLFLFTCGYIQYDKYFTDWARQPDVKNAFAKDYVDIGNYLNTLPAETISYVIVNQPGVLVKNIPVPAQTVMFIQETSNKKQETKYLLPEEIDKIHWSELSSEQNRSLAPITRLVVIPLQYEREIFRKLREKFPEGKIRFQESFWLFEK